MSELASEFATAAKYLAVGLLALLVLSPCIAILWKGTNIRRGLWRVGCWRWVICCDRIYGERVSRTDLMERGHGAQTVLAYYQLMFEDRERPSSALRLATWRENLRVHTPAGLSTRLQQIQIKDETMARDEPLVLPTQPIACDERSAAKQQEQQLNTRGQTSEYTPPAVVLAKAEPLAEQLSVETRHVRRTDSQLSEEEKTAEEP